MQKGDLWKLGEHLLYYGNSLKEISYKKLLQNELAQVVFTDPPYNVKIKGNVTKQKQHEEFELASGEMKKDEFTDFLKTAMSLQVRYSIDGSIHYQCMDWRHVSEMLDAGSEVYSSLKNICVWDKGTGGMGSLYRSQHEFIFVFKKGIKPHINNLELDVHGRYRTNVWKYKGMQLIGIVNNSQFCCNLEVIANAIQKNKQKNNNLSKLEFCKMAYKNYRSSFHRFPIL